MPTQDLVSPSVYRSVTKDTTSDGPDVEAALVDAVSLVEAHTNRILRAGTYTETLPLHANGRVYPAATPLTSVSSPAGATIDGAAVIVGSAAGTVWLGGGVIGSPATSTITYAGGFTAATLPVKLKRAICRVAYLIVNPATSFAQLPVGAKSASVGDVSVAGDSLAVFDVLDAATMRDLSRYTRRTVPVGRR